jgi:aspartate-semialdehyde dehydrogenase
MNGKLRAGILGATGAVGQKFVELLAEHPWFEVTALAASERSAGRRYRDVVRWIGTERLPDAVGELEVRPAEAPLDCDFVFCGLDASVAGELETVFAAAGYPVISNARNHRMDADVPLLVPEVNPDHVALVDRQTFGGGGFIVTNPNCSAVGLTMALAPLHRAFGVRGVAVTTFQALSGAGYPGVASLDAVGNVVPFIGGEEAKMVAEPRRILGTLAPGGVEDADIAISPQCNRVPVIDGHLECVSVRFDRKPASIGEVAACLRGFASPAVVAGLPSAPARPVQVLGADDAPQPRRDVMAGRGMTVSVGRVRACEVLDAKFVLLVHNTIRGAAGGAILNAELLIRTGYLKPRS